MFSGWFDRERDKEGARKEGEQCWKDEEDGKASSAGGVRGGSRDDGEAAAKVDVRGKHGRWCVAAREAKPSHAIHITCGFSHCACRRDPYSARHRRLCASRKYAISSLMAGLPCVIVRLPPKIYSQLCDLSIRIGKCGDSASACGNQCVEGQLKAWTSWLQLKQNSDSRGLSLTKYRPPYSPLF